MSESAVEPRESSPQPSPESMVVTQTPDVQKAIQLLRQWREEGDEQEQKETWEYLQRVLDEDRLSSRKLFP